MSESMADIASEMREGFNQSSWWGIDREWAHDLADRIEAAYKCECDAIERTVRDAIVAYDFDYPFAPNEDCERELVERAKTANGWLVAHGYEAEELTHMKGETK